VSVLVEPLPASVHALLRRAVLDHTRSERRRQFPARLHVGTPGARGPVHEIVEEGLGHAVRTDVAAALLAGAGQAHPDFPGPLVWLTRPGELTLHDVDAAWIPAVLAAGAESGVPPTVVVVTRRGWWDPRSDLRREWQRLRQR
jgi:hypothetical protein